MWKGSQFPNFIFCWNISVISFPGNQVDIWGGRHIKCKNDNLRKPFLIFISPSSNTVVLSHQHPSQYQIKWESPQENKLEHSHHLSWRQGTSLANPTLGRHWVVLSLFLFWKDWWDVTSWTDRLPDYTLLANKWETSRRRILENWHQ